jgi:hypothetical protein
MGDWPSQTAFVSMRFTCLPGGVEASVELPDACKILFLFGG